MSIILEIDHQRISLIFFQIHSTFFKALYGDKCGEFCTWISWAKRASIIMVGLQ